MIAVKIFRDQTGSVTGYSVSGHANTAPHGQDIVCAGVAALAQTAVLGIERHLGRNLKIKVASGDLKAELTEAPDALTDAVLESMILGLTEIAKLYPQNIRISEHRR